MKRVAVFGNAGGGKSTLARRLSELTNLPLYAVDAIQFRAGGGAVPHDEYLGAHAELVHRDTWIIDGFGCVASAWERFSAADTLVYVDLPLFIHYRLVVEAAAAKRVHHLKSPREMHAFLESIDQEYRGRLT